MERNHKSKPHLLDYQCNELHKVRELNDLVVKLKRDITALINEVKDYYEPNSEVVINTNQHYIEKSYSDEFIKYANLPAELYIRMDGCMMKMFMLNNILRESIPLYSYLYFKGRCILMLGVENGYTLIDARDTLLSQDKLNKLSELKTTYNRLKKKVIKFNTRYLYQNSEGVCFVTTDKINLTPNNKKEYTLLTEFDLRDFDKSKVLELGDLEDINVSSHNENLSYGLLDEESTELEELEELSESYLGVEEEEICDDCRELLEDCDCDETCFDCGELEWDCSCSQYNEDSEKTENNSNSSYSFTFTIDYNDKN